MKPLRVLIVFSSSELGGAERSLTRMALASPPGIYQLATLDGEGPWCDWVRGQGRQPLVFGRRNEVHHGRLGMGAFVMLFRHVRCEGIQIVYICGVRASLWLRLLKPFMPGVRLVHGIRWNPDSNSRLDRFFRVVERWLNGFVDLYITNSQIAAAALVRRCGISADKIRVIYNGLEKLPTNVSPLVDRPLNVLTVANLNPRKGYLEYLVAIENVLREIPDAHFIFVGRDDMDGKVQSAIVERGLCASVACVGFQQDVSPWMRSARILVVPSLWNEGCPTAVLEAMSYGVPIVGYDLDGLPELVRHNQDGVLVPIADADSLAAAIIKLLKDTEMASEMSTSSLARSQDQFLLESCVTKHQEALVLLGEAKLPKLINHEKY
ncbi:MAG: glycosyltransferase family 4 protein [Desulfobulbia bacterium]|jgi:glycosyltransferase involved in cell wall biosynthesis